MKLIIKSMIWKIRQEKNNQSEQEEKTIQKNEDSITSLWDNFRHSNIHIIGVPEGEEKEQDIGNLLETIMKETFLSLVKEIDMQVQEAQTSKQDECKEAHFKTYN